MPADVEDRAGIGGMNESCSAVVALPICSPQKQACTQAFANSPRSTAGARYSPKDVIGLGLVSAALLVPSPGLGLRELRKLDCGT